MDITKIYQLHQLLSNHRYPMPLQDILEDLECSKATFHRTYREMRDYLGAPIKNRKGEGYYYDLAANEQYELPGLWFSSKELVALSLLEQLSQSFQPELVKQLLTPVHERLAKLLNQQNITETDWQSRIKIVSQWQRPCEPKHFSQTAYALLHRQQLEIDYWQWQTDDTQGRIISPQRLVYYRDNWYLDAWCHLKQALRTFSVDAIRQANLINERAIDINVNDLNEHVMPGYGIFSGEVIGHAKLQFSKHISTRVSRENWHPQQTFSWTENNEYVLTIPYSDLRELVRDILRYGNDVEVLAPENLRQEIKKELGETLKKYN